MEKLAQLGIPPQVSDLYEEHANDPAHVQTSDGRVSRPLVNPPLLPLPLSVKAIAAQESLRDVTKAVSVAKGNEEQVDQPVPRSEAAQEAESRELQLKSHRLAIEVVAARAGAEAEAFALKAKTANDKKEGEGLVFSQTYQLAATSDVPPPAPPALVSSSLLLSPRLADASGGLHEGAEEDDEEIVKQPTHDLDISLADLEATVSALQPSSSDQESSTLASPLAEVTRATSSGSLDKVMSIEEVVVVEENNAVESPTPVSRFEDKNILAHALDQQEIQNISLSISHAEPDKREGLVDDAASPLFVDASPEPLVRPEVRIEQPASNSALSPGAALSSVSLSSPDFVLEDEGEGGVDAYYGGQDDSDSFDNDDTEDQFGDNLNLQEEDDDLSLEDAF